MTEREQNLLRAARFLRRLDQSYGGGLTVEGISAQQVAHDIELAVLSAQAHYELDLHSVRAAEIAERLSQPGPLRLIPGGAA